MLISPEYRALNEALHQSSNTFGGSGIWWAFHAKWAIDKYACESVLDYGCGKGSFVTNGWRVFGTGPVLAEYDPAIPGKDTPPLPADLVVCTDVLEHIEPDCIDDVMAHIAGLSRKAVFFIISTKPAKKTLPDGGMRTSSCGSGRGGSSASPNIGRWISA